MAMWYLYMGAWYCYWMPLRPEVRRERRAYAKQQEKLVNPPKFKKRRCKNCNALFDVTKPLNRPPQEFCQDECRKQYHHFGCAFGPLKVKLEKVVHQMTAESLRRVTELEARIRVLEQLTEP